MRGLCVVLVRGGAGGWCALRAGSFLRPPGTHRHEYCTSESHAQRVRATRGQHHHQHHYINVVSHHQTSDITLHTVGELVSHTWTCAASGSCSAAVMRTNQSAGECSKDHHHHLRSVVLRNLCFGGDNNLQYVFEPQLTTKTSRNTRLSHFLILLHSKNKWKQETVAFS